MTNPFGEGTSYRYLNNNWLWKRQMYNSSGTLLGGPIYGYNALGQATDLSNKNSSGSILSDFGSISHDGQGNRVSVTANIPGAPSAYSGVTGYSYDTKNELTQETSTRNGGYTNNFGFDGAGNPTSYIGPTQSFNSDNQRTGTGLAYDSNGNPTNYFGTTLSYDAENRVTQIGSALQNGYRADGLRAWKLPSGGSKIYFIYDGLTPVCEVNSSGTATATNTWGPDGLISRHTSSGSVFYTFDPQGNTVQRLSSSGSILNSNLYSAQGVAVTTASNTDPYSGFGAQWGYYTDVETGLQLLGHRFYDSSTGRFINRDPIGYAGGINLYNYGAANPMTNIDPSGHSLAGGVTTWLIGAGAVTLGTAGFIAAPAVVPIVAVGWVIGSAIGYLQGDSPIQAVGDAAMGGMQGVGDAGGFGGGNGDGGEGGEGGGGNEGGGEEGSGGVVLHRLLCDTEKEDIEHSGGLVQTKGNPVTNTRPGEYTRVYDPSYQTTMTNWGNFINGKYPGTYNWIANIPLDPTWIYERIGSDGGGSAVNVPEINGHLSGKITFTPFP